MRWPQVLRKPAGMSAAARPGIDGDDYGDRILLSINEVTARGQA